MARVPSDEDDTGGEPVFLIRPAENVYSYFMFIGPTESKRKKGEDTINWDIVMGYVLVVMNFFMQGILLFLIFEEVVVSNIEWQNGILQLNGGGAGGHFMALFSPPPEGCNDGGALCFHDPNNGMYTCAPPSVQLTGRWGELDTNGDNIWQRSEAVAAREDLKCKYAVDPLEVFDVLVNMLTLRENIIWLHPETKAGNAIFAPYFTYAMGDLIMCSYRNKDMCSNLIERGFFDAALEFGTSPRVGTTIDSALRYCWALLEADGTCESLLPSTYTVWKTQSRIECGEPAYEKFVYTHPKTQNQKSLLSVDYAAREEYELAQDVWFCLFKGIMLFSWLLAMLCEYRDMIKIATMLGRMPDAAEFGDDAVLVEQDPSDPEDVRYRIQGLTAAHRMHMAVLCLLRALITMVLAVVGVSYLIKTNNYADLIMNGVALVFIAEVSAVLYSQVLREEVKDQTEDIKAIKVRMYGIDYLNRRPALVDILCVLGLTALVFYIMAWQMSNIVHPVHGALECSCVASGSHCVEAVKYDRAFWSDYWKTAVPNVFSQVEQLKAGIQAGGATALAAAAPPVASATALVSTAASKVVEAMPKVVQAVRHLGGSSSETVEDRLAMLATEEATLQARLAALGG